MAIAETVPYRHTTLRNNTPIESSRSSRKVSRKENDEGKNRRPVHDDESSSAVIEPDGQGTGNAWREWLSVTVIFRRGRRRPPRRTPHHRLHPNILGVIP